MPKLPISFDDPIADDQALADYQAKLPIEMPQQLVGIDAANAVNNLFAPVNGVPRYQTWPETMLRSGASLPLETYQGKVPTSLGLRREDFTDIPQYPALSRNPDATPSPTWLGGKLGINEGQELGPSGELISRAQDMAGMAGGGFAAKPNAVTAMADSARTAAPIAALEHAPVFYSAVEKAVKEAKQPSASADQWLGYLRNQPGVKQEELDWVLHDLPHGKITKSELEQYVQEHKVELKEVNRGYDPEMTAKGKALAESQGWNWNDVSPNDRRRYIQRAAGAKLSEDIGGPKYANWQLPGGENYREQLLTLPEKPMGNPQKYIDKYGENFHSELTNKEREEYYGPRPYQSSHWSEPNVLAHIRTNERNIPGVGNSLHIEEIQSDWHQAGRKQGYKGELNELQPKFDAIEKKIIDSGDEQVMSHPELSDALKMAVDKKIITADEAKVYKRYSDISASGSTGGVPDAPLKTNWPDLALKRVIRQAAEQGKDSISWTPGEAQAARYDLSKQIEAIKAYKRPFDGNYQVSYIPKGQSSYVGVNEGRTIEPSKLADHVGKELAEKIIENNSGEYKGLDLKVGGEGMKAFYDKMLVDKANAIAKKFGGKVEQGNLPFNTKKIKRDDVGPDELAQAKYKEKWDKLVAEIRKRRENAADYDRKMSNEEWEQNNKDLRELNQQLDTLHEKGVDETIERMKQNTKGDKVHVLRITPQLRDAALNKGFSLFADTGKVGAPLAALTKVDHNPFTHTVTPVEHNPFTIDTYHGTGGSGGFRGTTIEPKTAYDIHHDTSSGKSEYRVWDTVNRQYISPKFNSKDLAADWLSSRVGSEFFSTPNPEMASEYATHTSKPAVLPLKLNTKDYHTFDAKGMPWQAANSKAIFEAEQLGKKGVIIKNVIDNPMDSVEIAAGLGKDHGPQTVYITLDPSTVRSRFAKFDPAKFHENGLMKASGLPIITDKDGKQLDHNLKPLSVDEQNALLDRNPLPTHKGPDGKAVPMPSKTALGLAALKAGEYAAWAARPALGSQLWAASILGGAVMNASPKKELKEGRPLSGYRLVPVQRDPFR